MKFDPEFIPDIGTNDVYLWGEAPNFGRVRFSIDSVILVDHLGVGIRSIARTILRIARPTGRGSSALVAALSREDWQIAYL